MTFIETADTDVLIMVETLDHAFELKALLPDYEVVYGDTTDDRFEALNIEQRFGDNFRSVDRKERSRLRTAFETGLLRKVIATTVWKQGVDFRGLNALVRADGGDSKINHGQIPGRLSRLHDGKDRGLLIDFDDRFDAWAARPSQQRFKFYEKMVWQFLNLQVTQPRS